MQLHPRFARTLACIVIAATLLPVVLSLVDLGTRDARPAGVGFAEISVSGGTAVPIVVAASFTRITGDDNKLIVNDRAQTTRDHVLAVIEANPGIHFRDICRQLKKEIGVVQYHVYILKRFGLVSSMRDGRFTRYFAKDAVLDEAGKNVVAAWQRPVERAIIQALLDSGGQPVPVATVARACGVTPQAVTWHLNRLVTSGLVTGWNADIEPLAPAVLAKITQLLARGLLSA